jgi:broad-specificity NMP kinase
MRTLPNIVITGTPGVGKTVHCDQVAQETGLRHLSINQVAKDRECHDGFDQERQSWIIDEDKVCLRLPMLWEVARLPQTPGRN